MLAVARGRTRTEGVADRCVFQAGLATSLPVEAPDGATSVPASQLLADATERRAFFADLAARLRLVGILGHTESAVRDGMTPDDHTAVIQERRGVAILKDGGEDYDHLQEAEQAMDSARRARWWVRLRRGSGQP